MNLTKNISYYIILGFITNLLSNWIESDFLIEYLKQNIIGLLLTLLAINIATLGLIASKMQDMLEKFPNFNFASTIKEMKFSLVEQIGLIVVSIISLVIINSNVIVFEFKAIIFNSILTSVLYYSIYILWDTGNAVFVIINLIQNMNNEPKE